MKVCIVSDSHDRADALGGRRVFVVHYDDYGYAMACAGQWDLVCCGHSHQAEERKARRIQCVYRHLANS